MSETEALFDVLRESAEPSAAAAIRRLVEQGSDRDVNRVNALAFAGAEGLPEEAVISAFVRAARLGLFDLSWNILCPGCGGVLNANTTLRSEERRGKEC